jgi:CheY-like chemotaxis protein
MVGMFRLNATTISPFRRDMARLRVGEGSAYLVDSKGRVIYHSDLARVGDDFSRGAIVQQVLSGQAGALRTRNLDWQLPGLAADHLLTTLREACPGLYVIALSGRPEARRAALAAGADAFVYKCDPPERLLAAIGDCQPPATGVSIKVNMRSA